MADVEISGLRRAMLRIATLPVRIREGRDEVLTDWADETKGAAKTRAPERTGNLRNAIEDRKFSDAAYVGVYKPDALEYAQYVEKGTSSMTEQPYLVPAFEWTTNRENIARKLRAAIRRRGLGV
jgi:HK97 gp10 family phage protein